MVSCNSCFFMEFGRKEAIKMIVTQTINVHLDRHSTPTIETVQSDTGRAVKALLFAQGQKWIPPEGATGMVRHSICHEGEFYTSAYDTLADGQTAVAFDGNEMTVGLSPEILSIAGVGELQVAILHGNALIATLTILLRVQRNIGVQGLKPTVFTDLSQHIQNEVVRQFRNVYDQGSWLENLHHGVHTGFTVGGIDTANGTEPDVKNRLRSEFIFHGGREVTVSFPAGVQVRCLFYDEELICRSESPFFKESFTLHDGQPYLRLEAGYEDEGNIQDPTALAAQIGVFYDQDYRGYIPALGASSFQECSQEGYYRFAKKDLQGISDAPDMDVGGILEVHPHGDGDAVFQTIRAADGGLWFRKGGDPFRPVTALGYTPIRGVDYWTEEDQTAIDADIAAEVAKRGQLQPEFANSVEDCTDTSKLYVLPDGYIYANLKQKVTQVDNQVAASALNATDHLNRLLNQDGTLTYSYGYITTPLLELGALKSPYTVNIKGVTVSYNNTNFYVGYYQGDALLGRKSFGNSATTVNDDGSYTINLYDAAYADADGAKLCFMTNGGNKITDESSYKELFVEFVPRNTETVTQVWANTGHAFVPADYEERIIALEQKTTATDEIPDYWQGAVDTAVTKVKALQDAGGQDVVNFLWFSDMHHNPGNPYTKNIGNLCAAVMEECNIPLCLMNGDTMSASADMVDSEDTLLAWLDDARKLLAPIGEGLLQICGNHDDVYGTYGNKSYVNKVSDRKIWNRLFRHQSEDFRRVFGGNGTYFYLDTPQKVRFICLNGQYYEGDGYADGTVSAMTSGFGADQLSWLEQALVLEEGWSAVIATHIPPTAQAVNGNTQYLSSYSDGEAFRQIIRNAGTKVIGIFCGHCHADAIVEQDLPCPILTVTCAIDSTYDGTSRTAGTDKETAIDIVSINKSDRTIQTIRLGAGSDRAADY